jgi:hypothetical protein
MGNLDIFNSYTKKRMMLAILSLFVLTVALMIFLPAKNSNWVTASRQSANLVPLAKDDLEAKVQIYSARAFSWRGRFSIHTWVAVKEKNAASYKVYHAALWNKNRGFGVVSQDEDLPDRYWYGAKPEIIFSISGKEAEEMIPQVYSAIENYPYHDLYRAYPGPNSNTFVSHVIRQVDGIDIALPSNAIGKDWLSDKLFDKSESGSGVQFSFYGLLGLIIDLREGIEVNILGLSFGVDFLRPALKLPFIGRFGMER